MTNVRGTMLYLPQHLKQSILTTLSETSKDNTNLITTKIVTNKKKNKSSPMCGMCAGQRGDMGISKIKWVEDLGDYMCRRCRQKHLPFIVR